MSIVNFAIPKNLDKRVRDVIKHKGFASRAEFFRFAAIFFIDIADRQPKTIDEIITEARRDYLANNYKTFKSARSLLAELKN